MISVDAHRARILGSISTLPSERFALADAQGLVLAEDIASRWPVPLFDNSAMDGYAVRRVDATAGAVLRIVADVAAGSADDPTLSPGTAARIMTGAAVPTDADAIVPLEQTDLGTDVGATPPAHITVLTPPAPGAHIRRVGEDAPAGAVTVAAGVALGPWQLSAIASAGYDTVRAYRPPRVAVISTGSELIAPSATPRRGQIPESNGHLLTALLRENGIDVVAARTVADDDDALSAVLAELRADAVILSGGASVGAFDVVKNVLAGNARSGAVDSGVDGTGVDSGVQFDQVAVQPGKPQGFGVTADGTALFCLPGNPVSVAVSFEMFVRPALRAMAGHTELFRPQVTRVAAESWNCPKNRAQVLPVVFDEVSVRPATAGGSGSHLVSSLASARAFALIPAEVERVDEGDPVSVMVLS